MKILFCALFAPQPPIKIVVSLPKIFLISRIILVSVFFLFKNPYHLYFLKISLLYLSNSFYICPSGNYGKFIYNYLNEQTKNNLLGFLDSCVYKIGKRLEGTDKYIYKKEKIMNYDKINILLVAGKYNDEIKDELINYNKNINLIYPHN